MKVTTPHNLLNKLAISKWGKMQVQSKSRPWRSVTRWGICLSSTERLAHAHRLDPKLNKACRDITGGSKRHSIQAVELSQQSQTAVQIVSNPPAPSNGVPIYRLFGPAG